MSLVGVIGNLLGLVTIAAIGLWGLSLKYGRGEQAYTVWRSATASLRERNALLPLVVGIVGTAVYWFVLVATGAFLAMLAAFGLLFIVPAFALVTFGHVGAGYGIGLVLGLISAFTDGEEPDDDTFTLPMQIATSKADDVSEWTSDAVSIPRRSLLTLGASGSGKSETLKHFVSQMDFRNAPVVVYDHKTDYREFLESLGVPITRISATGSDVRWNIFAEATDERDFEEIGRALFANAEDGDEFFGTAGRQLFVAVLKYLHRETENPTNANIARYFERTDPETMYTDLSSDGHEDLVAAASAIDPEAGRQSRGVFATTQQVVTDLFNDDFADAGDFSIREYMDNPSQYGVLVLDMPSRQAKTVAPIFKFLIDRGIAEGMDQPHRQAYYLLDEIEHMGIALSRLDELVNVGRGNSCQALISLQSVAQLYDTFGEQRAQAILSGMTTSVILRLADEKSIEFARSAIGTEFHEYTGHVEKRQSAFGNGQVEVSRETKLKEEHDFAKGDFTGFDPGECVVCRQGEGYVHGRVRMIGQQ